MRLTYSLWFSQPQLRVCKTTMVTFGLEVSVPVLQLDLDSWVLCCYDSYFPSLGYSYGALGRGYRCVAMVTLAIALLYINCLCLPKIHMFKS